MKGKCIIWTITLISGFRGVIITTTAAGWCNDHHHSYFLSLYYHYYLHRHGHTTYRCWCHHQAQSFHNASIRTEYYNYYVYWDTVVLRDFALFITCIKVKGTISHPQNIWTQYGMTMLNCYRRGDYEILQSNGSYNGLEVNKAHSYLK